MDAAQDMTRPSLLAVAGDIKLSHSIFALPFALLACFLAAAHGTGRLPGPAVLGLVVVCMVLARTVAMTVNRLADADYDALNPRTARRAIPSGRVSRRYVVGVTIACSLLFIAAAGGFWLLAGNIWPLVLSPIVLAWVAGYSLTKRFTWLCHLFLGSALAISPLAAAIAIWPGYLAEPTGWLLALMVMCWVAGFDVIYALQDVQVDRSHGIHSLPAWLGVSKAMWVSRLLHVISVAALVGVAGTSPQLGGGFKLGIAAVLGLLIVEHAAVWRSRSEGRINMAFFTINGVIALLLGSLGIVDVWRAVG